MKHRLPIIAALLVAPLSVFAAQPTRPNMVVFLCDDHGYLDSTVYGATDVRTPNMQRLAEAGMVLTHAFIASPSCAPSRAALLTGLMPARNGAEANHSFARPAIKGLPAYLQALGYEVAAFGKVAHGKDVARWDFDHWELAYDLTAVAKYVAGRTAAKPLCLFVGTHDPHVPWTKNTAYEPTRLTLPPTCYDTPETREFRADYYTEVTRADTDLGTLRKLAEERLGTNTVFIYSSDHGAQWPFGKWNLYDASLRTPWLAAWPGVIKPGHRSAALISWVDILPTLVELAGGTPPADIDGRSFAGILLGKAETHRPEIFTTHSGDGRMNVYPIRAVRTKDWKYIRNLHPEFAHTTHIDKAKDQDGLYYWRTWYAAAKAGNATAATIVKRYHERPSEELYDLRTDPFETNNLAALPEHKTKLRKFRTMLDAWMKAQGDKCTVFNQPRLLSDPQSTQPAQPPMEGRKKP